jgi:site-specific DNA-methyltransferase (adenine-specific)
MAKSKEQPSTSLLTYCALVSTLERLDELDEKAAESVRVTLDGMWGALTEPEKESIEANVALFAPKKRLDAPLSSKRHDWRTPGWILGAIREFSGGQITLDPCAAPADIDMVRAAINYRLPEHDGLKESWDVKGLVFVNPPYGRELSEWTGKLTREIDAAERNLECILLVPARTDTRWFRTDIVGRANRILFLTGRLNFDDGPVGAPFPSCLVYYGVNGDRFEQFWKALDVGWIWRWR